MGSLQWSRKLSMGDEIKAFTDHIEIGPISLEFGRLVERKDMEAVCTVYAMGLAARSRFVSVALNQFLKATEPVEIVGFRDPESGKVDDSDR